MEHSNGHDKIRVLIVDDHAVVRKGLRLILDAESDVLVVGEAGNGHEAIARARELKPDIVIMDIGLPDMNGLEATGIIKESQPDTKVVMLTMHEDEDYFFRALKVGAHGYVVKGAQVEDILAALRAAQQGGIFLYPVLAKTLVNEYLAGDSGAAGVLSPREGEVLRGIAQGMTNKEIASQLSISVTTAQTHRSRIMEKLGLHSQAELIRYAIRKGLVRA
ncbi:MAG: response regulator transcription factor [Chloroflexi bacterium]|nr:response regulator transcription factor [Chloroflexota bacterium]